MPEVKEKAPAANEGLSDHLGAGSPLSIPAKSHPYLAVSVAQVLDAELCSPQCIVSASRAKGCRCRCKGSWHGRAAGVLLETVGGHHEAR